VRRAGLGALAVLVALVGTVGLIAFFQSRDDSQIDGGSGDDAGRPTYGVASPSETGAVLERGNVVLTYREAADRAGLVALAHDVAGTYSRELADAGQAVLVEQKDGQGERIVAHAYKRRLAAQSPQDPALRQFVEGWLGEGGLRP
jgi:hypothetical protein